MKKLDFAVHPLKKMIPGFSIILILVFTQIPLKAADPQKWNEAYLRLKNHVEENVEQPPENSPVETYLEWMETKAADRDEVKSLLDEAGRLSQQNPDDQELKEWVQRFSKLLVDAQNSGESTVNGAVLWHMNLQDPASRRLDNWKGVISRLKNDGRRIYLKAQETDFLTPTVKEYAKCMINFSIRSVESDPRGHGVYRGREGLFGEIDEEGNIVIPERDFNVYCEPRDAFTYTSKGEPDKPSDMGLDWINQVREEARWWNFGDAVEDATDLMEEYFKDSMCKTPPNRCDKGHKQYKELAKKYELPEGLEYNEGFYGKLHGQVMVVSSSGRVPAKEATVTVKSLLDDETWTGTTDEEGKYEIDHVLLHKECKPLIITAQYGNDEVVDSFFGPLENPDPGASHEKNLEIKKGHASFQIVVDSYWEEPHTLEEDGKTPSEEGIGSSGLVIEGSLIYLPDESNSLQDFYEIRDVRVKYVYFEKVYDYGHSPNCPEVIGEYVDQGVYSYNPPPPSKALLQKTPPGAPLGDTFLFMMAGPIEIKIKGIRRECDPMGRHVITKPATNPVEFLGVHLMIPARQARGQASRKICDNSFSAEFDLAITPVFGLEETEPCEIGVQKIQWRFSGLKKKQ